MKKLLFTFILAMFILMPSVKADVARIEVNKGWQFKQVRGIWKFPTYPAEVPGVVHTDLMRNNVIEDPFFRLNERAVQWIDKEDWEYTTKFTVNNDILSKENIQLVFKGLDNYADVYLNDEKVLVADNMFREWVVDCKGKLKNENTLRIYFHSPIKIDLPKLLALPYRYEAGNDQSENGGLLDMKVSIFARKAGYQYGWDWGPRLVTIGIWRPVYIEAWSDARIENVQVLQQNVSDKSATIKAIVEVNASKDMAADIAISNNADATAYAQTQTTLKKGINKVAVSFNIKNPRLWWTNGLGEQHLYPFKITINSNNKLLDSRVENIGVRSLKLVREKDKDGDGKSFYFELNGKPVFMKGANYIPCDNFLPRVTAQRYEQVVLDARNANMNMLRIWGGGVYEDDVFYNLCDKYGILIWQDFMFACSVYPADSAMLENIRHEAIDNVKRLRNHPCIALWCGNNEMNDAYFHWGWKKRYEKQSQDIADKIWGEYEAVFHQVLPEVVKQYDPQTEYWPSSPISEWGSTESNKKSGDMHYWSVWHGRAPFTDYAKEIPRFMSEYGFQSFPSFNSVRRYAPEAEDWDIYSEVMLLHQRNPYGNMLIKDYMSKEYREPKDFRSLLYMSQLLQADGLRIAEEAHRRHMPYCMGSLYWQHNDCWPVASWSSTDYYGRWKALHYATKRGFEPILISPFLEDNGTLTVHVVSDKFTPLKATLKLRIFDLQGNEVYKKDENITVPSNASKLFFSQDVDKLLNGKKRNEVVLYAELVDKTETLATSYYYLAKTKDIDFPKATVSYTMKKVGNGYELTLNTNKLARGVYVSFDERHDYFLSDNYFDMLPNKPYTVKITTTLAQTDLEKQLRIISMCDAY